MDYAVNPSKTVLLTRLELLEREIADLKEKILHLDHVQEVNLRGIWSDIEVTDEDIAAAKWQAR